MNLQHYIAAAKAMHADGPAQHVARYEISCLSADEIAALLLEADALLPKWKDISEAPRNVPVLLFGPNGIELGFASQGWQSSGPYGVVSTVSAHASATHFMPLSGAPK